MVSNKSLILGHVSAIILSIFVIGLIFSTAVFGEENTMIAWKTNILCSYTPKSGVAPEHSGCVRLNNVIFLSSSENFAFVAQSDIDGGVSLYVINTNYENLTDNNFIYDGVPTKTIKYQNMFSILGAPKAVCADRKNFAYGTPLSEIVIYDGGANLKTGSKILDGSPLSCDLDGENLAVCTAGKVYVLDRRGNIKWSRDHGCKKVKILNNKIFVTNSNKFLVFSMDGSLIFSKDINIRDMDGTDKIVIASSDGIYTYEENLNNLDKLVNDTAVIGIAGLNKAFAYVTPLTLRVVSYNKSILFEYAMKPHTHFVSISGDKNYAVASTDVADPDIVIIDITDMADGKIYYEEKKVEDIGGKIRSLHLEDGMLLYLLPFNEIGFKNFVGISAQEAIAEGDDILREIMNVGATSAEKKQINDTLNKMKNAFKKRDYAHVLETVKYLRKQAITIGNSYVLQEKYLTANLLEMLSEKGMVLPAGIKLRYDKAIEKMLAGKYKGAIDDFRGVRAETEQHVRDSALALLDDVEKRKRALDKFAESTEEITKFAEKIESEKDYVNAFVLLEDVRKLKYLTEKRMGELFNKAEEAKKEAETPWLIFEANVVEIEGLIQQAYIAEDEKDYEKVIMKLSMATKEAKKFDAISKAQDVCVIAIIVGTILLIILFIRRPRIKKE